MTSDETLPVPASAALAAGEPGGRAIDGPVTSVTVLEDRAHIVRRGRVELPYGPTRLTLEGVSPVIVDKTLRATLQPLDANGDPAPRVFDVRCRRLLRTLRSESHEDVATLELAFQNTERRLAALADERGRLKTQLAQLDAAQRLFWTETAADVAWNRSPTEQSSVEASRLGEVESVARRRLVDLDFEVEDAVQERDDVQRRLNAAAHPGSQWAAAIELDVEATSPGAYGIEIDYVTPNACWRPSHVARLDASGKLTFSAAATVWQNTGETWRDVELSCSTERPSLGVEPPALSTDRITTRRKPPTVEIEARDQTIQTAGLGSEDAPEPQVSVPSDTRVPGVDDNGEPQHLKCLGRANVPSDGRPHRLPLFDFETDAKAETVVAAELAPAAIVKTTQPNRSGKSLLAGPVDLIRDGGLIGRTSLRFIAPQENFALGWGPDPDVRVHRIEERHAPEPKLLSLSSWTATTRHVQVRLSNVGPNVKTITVRERVPISEIEKVQIVFDAQRTTGKQRPDADGFVSWTITLAPFGRALVELWYDVKKAGDVVGAP